MASQLQCAFCFEHLVASLEERNALSYKQAQQYWEKFGTPKESENGSTSLKNGDVIGSPNPETTKSKSIKLDPTEEFPLFVTWKARTSRSSHELRGCKGTFRALPLTKGLAEFALISAFEDHRFTPINESELPSLTCDVTLLHSFEPCENRLDWTIGTHGIRISFEDGSKKCGATFLPDVMVEQGWDQKDAIISAVKKSGSRALSKNMREGMSKWEVVEEMDVQVTRYQGWKTHMKYAEWRDWRSWVDEEEEEAEVAGKTRADTEVEEKED